MKKPIFHTVLSWFLLAVFVHANVGSILLSFSRELFDSEEMETAMAQKGADFHFVFSESEWKQEVCKIGQHDYLYRGELYDMVKVERAGGKIIFHARKDDRETKDMNRLAMQLDQCTSPGKKTQDKIQVAFSSEKLYTKDSFSVPLCTSPAAAFAHEIPPGDPPFRISTCPPVQPPEMAA